MNKNTHLSGVIISHDQLLGLWLADNVVTVHVPEVHGSLPVFQSPEQISLLVHKRGPQQFQGIDALRVARLQNIK